MNLWLSPTRLPDDTFDDTFFLERNQESEKALANKGFGWMAAGGLEPSTRGL